MEVPVKSEKNGEVACSSGTTSRRPRLPMYQYQLPRVPLPFMARAPLLLCLNCINDPQVIAAHSGNPTVVWPPNCINCNAPINRPKLVPPKLVQRPSESRPQPEPEPRPPPPLQAAPPQATSKLPCPECGKLFANSSSLKRHKQLHSTELKYPCKMCPMMFRTTQQAYHHRKKCQQQNLNQKETQTNVQKKVETEATATTTTTPAARVNRRNRKKVTPAAKATGATTMTPAAGVMRNVNLENLTFPRTPNVPNGDAGNYETEVTATTTTTPDSEAEVNLKSPTVNFAFQDGPVQPVQDDHDGKDVPLDLSKGSTSTFTSTSTPPYKIISDPGVDTNEDKVEEATNENLEPEPAEVEKVQQKTDPFAAMTSIPTSTCTVTAAPTSTTTMITYDVDSYYYANEDDDDVLDNIEIIQIENFELQQMQIDTEGERGEDNSEAEAEIVPVTPVAFSNTEEMETDTESGTETESTECGENSSEDEAEPEPVPPAAPSNVPVIIIPLERSMPVTPALEQPKPEWVQVSDDEMSASANAESMTDVAPSRMVQMETDVEAADEDESGGKEAEADAEAEPEPVAQVAPSEPPVPATIASALEQPKPEWVRGVKNVTERYRKCIFCGRNFPTNSKQNMEQHLNTTHTFENWYFCAHCPAALKTHTALKTHVKKVHPKESRKAPVQNVNPEVSMPSKRAKTMAKRKSEPKPTPAAKRVTRTSTSTATSTSKKEKETPKRQSQRSTKQKPKPEPKRKPKGKVEPPKPKPQPKRKPKGKVAPPKPERKVSKAKPRVPKVSKPKVSKPKAKAPVSKKRPHVQSSTSVPVPSLFPGVPFSPAVAVADMMNGADDGSGNQDNGNAFLRWNGGVSVPVYNVLNQDDFQFMLAQGILKSDEIPASNSVDLAM